MLAFSFLILLIPLWILLGLLVIVAVLALLSRIRGGRYLRPLLGAMAKVPLLRRWLEKASRSALERSNPELASAMRKLERAGAVNDPRKAQIVMSKLSKQERRALLEMQEQQGAEGVQPTNREMRRRLEKAKNKARH